MRAFAHFLIPKRVIESDGVGEAFGLSDAQRELLQMTLEITRVVEQQSLEVRLEGSPDGVAWAEKPLAAFPQKFYAGAAVMVFDLAAHPEVHFVRASWKANRWGRGSLKPHFEVYLFAEWIASVALDSK